MLGKYSTTDLHPTPFWERVSLYSPGCLQTYDILALVSQVLWLQGRCHYDQLIYILYTEPEGGDRDQPKALHVRQAISELPSLCILLCSPGWLWTWVFLTLPFQVLGIWMCTSMSSWKILLYSIFSELIFWLQPVQWGQPWNFPHDTILALKYFGALWILYTRIGNTQSVYIFLLPSL